jgi:hypothetical protein
VLKWPDRAAVDAAVRALDFDPTSLPVPADLLVYTEDEWRALPEASPRFARRLAVETVWVL